MGELKAICHSFLCIFNICNFVIESFKIATELNNMLMELSLGSDHFNDRLLKKIKFNKFIQLAKVKNLLHLTRGPK